MSSGAEFVEARGKGPFVSHASTETATKGEGWKAREGGKAWEGGKARYPNASEHAAIRDLNGRARPAAASRAHGLDLLDDVHALDDRAEDDVLAVEPGVVTAVERKNCEPLVFGPALAMLRARRARCA